MIKGVDISAIQGNVDFKWLKSQGIEFVIIRCAVGNNGPDKLYSSYVSKAKEANLKVMAYHFAFPLPDDGIHLGRSPLEQAKQHFEAAKGELAALDIEWPIPQDWKKWNCNAKQVNQWVLDYLKEYERLSGYKMVVYTYPSFAQSVNFSPELANYPLWIASYQSKPLIPKPWTDWVIWQTAGGSLLHLPNGMPVDTNVAKDLSLWDKTAESKPEEPTEKQNVFSKVIGLFGKLLK